MTNQYFLDRIAARDANIRAGDADRERTAERLRNCHAEGRLDMDEFQQRLERCYAAKTLDDLRELVGDLPRQDDHDYRRPLGSFPPGRVTLLIPILIVLIAVLAGNGQHFFWLWIPLAFLFWRMSWLRRRRWPAGAGARRGPDGWV